MQAQGLHSQKHCYARSVHMGMFQPIVMLDICIFSQGSQLVAHKERLSTNTSENSTPDWCCGYDTDSIIIR